MTDTKFSDFIRNATPEEKARVYGEVMAEACEMQRKVMTDTEELAALRAFAQEVMECWPDGAPDGGELQEAAVKHGLLTLTTPIVPCGENCGCSEFYSAGEEAECYRRTPLLTGEGSDRKRVAGMYEIESDRCVVVDHHDPVPLHGFKNVWIVDASND